MFLARKGRAIEKDQGTISYLGGVSWKVRSRMSAPSLGY